MDEKTLFTPFDEITQTKELQMLKTIDNYSFEIGFISGRIDGGTLYIDLPDNIFTTLLFGSKKSISFGESDFAELKNLLTE